MKTIISLLLITLLVSSNGCMTYSAVQEAKGRHDRAVWMGQNSYGHDDKSHPGYYFLMPLTIPGDVAFSPFEVYWWCSRQMEIERWKDNQPPNQPDSARPAMAPCLTIEDTERRVADLDR